MEAEALKKLERKYWQGTANVEEETLLRAEARRKNSALTEAFQTLAARSDEAGGQRLHADFEAEFWREARRTQGESRTRNAVRIRWAAAIVALPAMALVLRLAIDHSPEQSKTAVVQSDTYQDPEAAFAHVRSALMFTSAKLNEGAEPLEKLGKFDEARSTVSRTAGHKDTLR